MGQTSRTCCDGALRPSTRSSRAPTWATSPSIAGWSPVRAAGSMRSAEWAAQSVCTLHPKLAAMDVAHAARVEGPNEGDGQQLTLS